MSCFHISHHTHTYFHCLHTTCHVSTSLTTHTHTQLHCLHTTCHVSTSLTTHTHTAPLSAHNMSCFHISHHAHTHSSTVCTQHVMFPHLSPRTHTHSSTVCTQHVMFPHLSPRTHTHRYRQAHNMDLDAHTHTHCCKRHTHTHGAHTTRVKHTHTHTRMWQTDMQTGVCVGGGEWAIQPRPNRQRLTRKRRGDRTRQLQRHRVSDTEVRQAQDLDVAAIDGGVKRHVVLLVLEGQQRLPLVPRLHGCPTPHRSQVNRHTGRLYNSTVSGLAYTTQVTGQETYR